MTDLGLKTPGTAVAEREIQQLANAWVNEPGMQKIALQMARECRVPPGEPFNRLRSLLAVYSAECYLKGRATGRARIITLPELPMPRND